MKKLRIAVVGVVFAMLFGSTAAYAVHTEFPDVPLSHPFHDDIEFLVDAGISGGFGDGTWKPDREVTRGQMARFMNRLAGVLTPEVYRVAEQTTTNSEFCETAPYEVPNYEQTAYITSAWSSIASGDDTSRWTNIEYSVNGGATWTQASNQVTIVGGPANFYTHNTETNAVALNPNGTYLFRLDAASQSGITAGQCEIVVTIFLRSPGQVVGNASGAGATGPGTVAGE